MTRRGKKRSISGTSNATQFEISVCNTTTMSEASFSFDASRYTQTFLKQSVDSMIKNAELTAQNEINAIKMKLNLIKNNLKPEVLTLPVNLKQVNGLLEILQDYIIKQAKDKEIEARTPIGSTTLPRRSRSVRSVNRLAPIVESPRPRRSCSAGSANQVNSAKTPFRSNIFKTPMHSQTKNHPFQRLMRPGEMAVSTTGSPLFVQGRAPAQPEVLIPLENGVIYNIDPENAHSNMPMPFLDAKTKNMLKKICDGLQKCLQE